MAMAFRALLVPVPIIGYCLRPLLVDGLQPLDRDVQIPHGAEMGVQPFQFTLYSRSFGVDNHRREKQYGSPQSRERNPHLMQRRGVAPACRIMICGQNPDTAARHDPKCRIARYHWIQPWARQPSPPFGTGG